MKKNIKVALVHDYLSEFGGAERVLKVISDIYPKAPIYTAFTIKGSDAHNQFKNKKTIESKIAPFIKHFNLYSPLRFLLPWIWGSIDLSDYDLVITSTSNYIARGFKTGKNTTVVAYCHTPPRWLYGYKTGDLLKILPIRIYATLIAHFIRIFDYNCAQSINHWLVNSKNVGARVQKFYRKESTVIYPPIDTKQFAKIAKKETKKDQPADEEGFYFIASRLIGTKGIVEAAIAANSLGIKLKIAGAATGLLSVNRKLKQLAGNNVELLGRVSDNQLAKLYAQAKGFIALAKDEDFGITVVESQASGTPVIAFKGGGFLESVIEGKTGIFVENTDPKTLEKAFQKFEKIKWDKQAIIKNAQKFSKERFIKEFNHYVKKLNLYARTTRT